MNEFIESSKLPGSEVGNAFEITEEAMEAGIATRIRKETALLQLLNNVSKKKFDLFLLLGVNKADMSPFMGEFSGDLEDEMVDRFLDYMPSTFAPMQTAKR